VRRIGDPTRIAAAVAPLCDARAHESQLAELRRAIRLGHAALAERDLSLAAAHTRIGDLQQQQEEWRRASPDLDLIIVPPGDPWLVRARPFGVRPGARSAAPEPVAEQRRR
jgi:hypothetical protein